MRVCTRWCVVGLCVTRCTLSVLGLHTPSFLSTGWHFVHQCTSIWVYTPGECNVLVLVATLPAAICSRICTLPGPEHSGVCTLGL